MTYVVSDQKHVLGGNTSGDSGPKINPVLARQTDFDCHQCGLSCHRYFFYPSTYPSDLTPQLGEFGEAFAVA